MYTKPDPQIPRIDDSQPKSEAALASLLEQLKERQDRQAADYHARGVKITQLESELKRKDIEGDRVRHLLTSECAERIRLQVALDKALEELANEKESRRQISRSSLPRAKIDRASLAALRVGDVVQIAYDSGSVYGTKIQRTGTIVNRDDSRSEELELYCSFSDEIYDAGLRHVERWIGSEV